MMNMNGKNGNQTAGFLRNHWKGLLALGGFITAALYWASKERDEHPMEFSDRWFKNATDDELDSERERVRERYVDGTADLREADRLYKLLHRFDREMNHRENEKCEEEHPYAWLRTREHGWYLQNDD